MTEPLIVHCHIFKNAGSSIVAAFRRAFGDRVVELEPAHPDALLAPQDIERHLEARPDAVMISSHRIRLPFPATMAGRPVLPLVFIRDPLERLASVYRFERRAGRPGAYAALARCATLEGFALALLRSGLEVLASNVQARFCCDAAPPTEAAAIAGLEGAMVGLVEHYSDSMALVERNVRRWHPGCDLTGPSENTTREPSGIVTDAARTLNELGPAAAGALLARNRVDIAVYAHVAAELRQRLAEPGAEGARRDFRARQGDRHDEAITPECPSQRAAALARNAAAGHAAAQARAAGRDAWVPLDACDDASTVRITAARVRGPDASSHPLLEPGERVRFEMKAEWLRAVADPIVGFTVRDRFGRTIWCMNTAWTDPPLASVEGPMARVYTLECVLPELNGGIYSIDAEAAVGRPGQARMLASARDAATFAVAAHGERVPAGTLFVRAVALSTRAGDEAETAEPRGISASG